MNLGWVLKYPDRDKNTPKILTTFRSSSNCVVCFQMVCWQSSDSPSIWDDRNVWTHSKVWRSSAWGGKLTHSDRMSGQDGSSMSSSSGVADNTAARRCRSVGSEGVSTAKSPSAAEPNTAIAMWHKTTITNHRKRIFWRAIWISNGGRILP